MKSIPLSKGKEALVDDEDFKILADYAWHTSSTGYAARTHWFGRQHTPKHRHVWMHREILGVTDSRIEVDHLNGDKLDNRRENLRICTHRQNASNRGKTRANTSGFKGVTKHGGKHRKGWIAQIRVKGKNIYLGYFLAPDLAAKAYDDAAALHFGEFARTNVYEGVRYN